MSGSTSNNSWTILTPEETAAETLGPLAEGRKCQDEHRATTEEFGAKPTDGAEGLSVEDHSMSEERTTKQSGGSDHDGCAPDFHIPASSSEVTSSAVPYSQPEDQAVDFAQCSSEPDSFSDSDTHLRASPEESPTSPPTTETLGHLDLVRGQTDDDTLLQTPEQEFQQGGEESHLPHLEKTQESPVETEAVLENTETTASEGEPEVRRRRRSLLAALERIGRTDEEEEAEEDFQLPQREEDTGLTLNKCILGAVILLGLGTIFFSGVFMDLEEESDYATTELNDSEAPVKQEWLNPAVAPPAADADNGELLNKLAEGNEHITMLQAQLQAQNEELKVAKGQAAEGTTELLQQEEVEEENTAASSSPSGQTEDSRQKQKDQGQNKDKHDMGERKEWNDAEKSEWTKEKKHLKDGSRMESKDKERKKDKPKERREEGKHKKHSEEPKEWKKEKSKTGDDGKPWEDKNKRKELTGKSDKKLKHDQFNGNSQWSSKEEKRSLKEGKHHGDWHKGSKEKQWIKETDGHKEEGKYKYERGDRKERGEKEWRKDNDWKSKNGERKQWSENDWKNNKDEKKWKKRDNSKQLSNNEEVWEGGDGREKKHKEEWHEDKSSFDKHKHMGSDRKDHKWAEKNPTHSHRKPSPQQPEYWVQQKDRLQHSTRPLQLCNSLEACAQAEGVRPVLFSEFEEILQTYLSKAQSAGVDSSQIDEFRKLATESFKNGVFVHDQMSFQEYVEDLGDILEDLVEGEEGDEDQDSALEDEMEGFEREVMQKFMLSGSGEQGRVKEEWRKESGRGRG